ncbi:MAG: AmmeMemoRadiSam system radical SAM enzyme [Elusimicrobiota bacterium]
MKLDVICELCPKLCRIPDGAAGDCRVRVNIGGKLRTTIYGRPSSVHIDPIEKKPLAHFLPRSRTFSIATAGCNLHCRNCQNWQLSQRDGAEMEVRFKAEPERVVAEAVRTGCLSIAYTYSDPVVFYEYVYDTARLAAERGIKNVLVTAGYINRQPLKRLLKHIDASNTDLKYFDDALYKKYSDAGLRPVLDALVLQKEENVWLEVTNLVIPTLNDDMAVVRRMAKWMAANLGADTPLHFSRFFPQYQMQNLPPTPAATLLNARREAMDAGLKYVYVGNLHGHDAESTICPTDGKILVRRIGYLVPEIHIKNGRCEYCRTPIAGRWSL